MITSLTPEQLRKLADNLEVIQRSKSTAQTFAAQPQRVKQISEALLKHDFAEVDKLMGEFDEAHSCMRYELLNLCQQFQAEHDEKCKQEA